MVGKCKKEKKDEVVTMDKNVEKWKRFFTRSQMAKCMEELARELIQLIEQGSFSQRAYT